MIGYQFDSSSFANCAWQDVHLASKVIDQACWLTIGLRLNGAGQACIKRIVVREIKAADANIPVAEKALNLDFSAGESGKMPEHWFVFQKVGSMNYRSALLDLPGPRCVLLKSLPGKTSERCLFFQRISALPFRSRHVVFEADLKADLKESPGTACLFVSPQGRESGSYNDKRQNQPVTGKDWRHYRAEADILSDCNQIDIGMELYGAGSLFLKNVQLSTSAASGRGNMPASALSEKEVVCLKAFARLLGYMRFFDPSVNRSSYWWNQYAVWSVNEITKKAADKRDISDILAEIILPVDPTISIKSGLSSSAPAGESAGICFWEHHGYGVEPAPVNAGYVSRISRQAQQINSSPLPSCLNRQLTADLACSIRQVCSHLPASRAPALLLSDHDGAWTAGGDDRVSRLAAVIVAWNAFKHFYPYQDVSNCNWDRILDKALAQAALDRDKSSFYFTLCKMTAALGDNQARVFCDDIEGAGLVSTEYTAPFLFHWLADNKIVVSTPKGTESPDGQLVSEAGKVPVLTALADREQLVSAATEQWKQYRALQMLQAGALYSEFCFADKDSDQEHKHELSWRVARSIPFVTTVTSCGIMTSHLLDNRPEKVHFLTPEILYIDLTRVSARELQAALVKARQVRGVVFDCRGELRLPVQSFLGCLSDRPVPSPRFLLPVITQPDFEKVDFEPVGFICKPQAPRIRARVVFIADESSAGNMETALAMVQNSGLGTIVGKNTAGTVGGIALVSLPGNYFVTFTGIKTLKPDGKRMHGVGIAPDCPGDITRSGISAGLDELLEAGLRELKRR